MLTSRRIISLSLRLLDYPFTNSGVIATKEFVARCYQKVKTHFTSRNEEQPRPIAGLDGVYSLKRFSEGIQVVRERTRFREVFGGAWHRGSDGSHRLRGSRFTTEDTKEPTAVIGPDPEGFFRGLCGVRERSDTGERLGFVSRTAVNARRKAQAEAHDVLCTQALQWLSPP
jgi:hypothetical protein